MSGQINQPFPQVDNNQGPVIIDSKAFGAKYTSKRECYGFLSHDCGAYLASYQSMTIWHLRDVISGERSWIKESDVKQITVPYFEGLKIEISHFVVVF